MKKLRLLFIFFFINSFQSNLRANIYFSTKNLANLKQQYYQQTSSREKEERCFNEKVGRSYEGKYHSQISGSSESWIEFNGKTTILAFQNGVERWSLRYPDYKCKVDFFKYGVPYYFVENKGSFEGYGPDAFFKCSHQQFYKVTFELRGNELLAYQIEDFPMSDGKVRRIDVSTPYFSGILTKNFKLDPACWHKSNNFQSFDISTGDVIKKKKFLFF